MLYIDPEWRNEWAVDEYFWGVKINYTFCLEYNSGYLWNSLELPGWRFQALPPLDSKRQPKQRGQ